MLGSTLAQIAAIPTSASTDPSVASSRGPRRAMARDCHHVPSVHAIEHSATTTPASAIERPRRCVSSNGMKLSVAKNPNASRKAAAADAARGVAARNVPGGRILRSAGTSAAMPATATGTVQGRRSVRAVSAAVAPIASSAIHPSPTGAAARSARGVPRSSGRAIHAATATMGSETSRAHRHPIVDANSAPIGGPATPGTTQAAVRSAMIFGR